MTPTDVHIRPWSREDLQLLERLMGDPVMTEHLGGPESREEISQRYERYCQSSATGKDPMFVILAGPKKNAAGSIGYWEREWHGQTIWETGWSVLPEFQGGGLATRAISLVVERARAEGRHRFMHAFPSVGNGPSNAICRKTGFTLLQEVDLETRWVILCATMTGAWTWQARTQSRPNYDIDGSSLMNLF